MGEVHEDLDELPVEHVSDIGRERPRALRSQNSSGSRVPRTKLRAPRERDS